MSWGNSYNYIFSGLVLKWHQHRKQTVIWHVFAKYWMLYVMN